MNLVFWGISHANIFLDFLHVITNMYTVLNQKVSFLLQCFEGKIHISGRLTGLMLH